MSTQTVNPEEYTAWCKFIRESTGIVLDQTKVYLVEARLSAMVKETNSKSFGDLLSKVRSDATKTLHRQVVNKITTQETSFFRDQAPFEMLKFKIIPDLIDSRRKQSPTVKKIPIRIWSAACSTGQEVYSILIALREVLGDLNAYNVHVLGTDISDQALAKSSYGAYTRMELDRGMPESTLLNSFDKHGDQWKIKDELRAFASFRQFNLHENFAQLGRWDIIFCRNVAIYFSDEDKKSLFNRFGSVLEPDGCLLIGSTESLLGVCPQFIAQRHLRSVYYKL